MDVTDSSRKTSLSVAVSGGDKMTDIRDITVYGTGQDRSNAVAVVEGKFDTQKLLSLIRLNSQYQEIPYKGSTLHRWRQEERKDPQASSDQKGEQHGAMIA